ncbi:MAG: hypothetical protein GKS00_22390 [Alphaproteobacteria bacterium]|nr:hypothetical protein [Alphaproteobacteria bacterium]
MTAAFDSTSIPAGPSEGRRQSEPAPDSRRITPVNEGEELRADRRKTDPNENKPAERPGRIAFTAKFGPDADGFPLQLVSGDDVTAAERIDFEVIAARRLSREDREVLLRAQEAESAVSETARLKDAKESTDETTRAIEERERNAAEARTGSTVDLQI